MVHGEHLVSIVYRLAAYPFEIAKIKHCFGFCMCKPAWNGAETFVILPCSSSYVMTERMNWSRATVMEQQPGVNNECVRAPQNKKRASYISSMFTCAFGVRKTSSHEAISSRGGWGFLVENLIDFMSEWWRRPRARCWGRNHSQWSQRCCDVLAAVWAPWYGYDNISPTEMRLQREMMIGNIL